ncbi:MAG: hypothetical protein ACI8YQ_000186 [Polaribacter sp.]|jgi:hypothetical protein
MLNVNVPLCLSGRQRYVRITQKLELLWKSKIRKGQGNVWKLGDGLLSQTQKDDIFWPSERGLIF